MKKFNWGWALAICLGIFTIAMGTTLYRASQHDWDLVTKDYYEAELTYQEVIDGKNNAGQLSAPASVSANAESIRLNLPEELQGKTGEGHLEWYCTQEADNDFTTQLENWEVSNLQWPTSRFKSGRWVAKLTLEVEGTPYYFEPVVYIP